MRKEAERSTAWCYVILRATGSFDSSELFNVEKKIGGWIPKIQK